METTEQKTEKKRKWPKILLGGLGVLLAAAIVTAAVVLYAPLSTMATVKQVDGQLYQITYRQDYKLDEALAANMVSEKALMQFFSEQFFFGYPIEGNQSYFACSAFLTQTPDGQNIAGRNFDFTETNTLAVYTTPRDGYASIGMASLEMVGVGTSDGFPVTSALGKFAMQAAPYLCMDGMNEKGLTVAILDLDPPEFHYYSEKPNLLIPVAVRLLLDHAANVDEAVALLGQYNMHSVHGWAQHLFIADAEGNSAVVEWKKGEMYVTNTPVCTNFWFLKYEDYAGHCDRFDTLTQRLADQPESTCEDAMQHLEAASVDWTQWSCVYHLSDFAVDIALDCGYDKVYRFTPNNFK